MQPLQPNTTTVYLDLTTYLSASTSFQVHTLYRGEVNQYEMNRLEHSFFMVN